MEVQDEGIGVEEEFVHYTNLQTKVRPMNIRPVFAKAQSSCMLLTITLVIVFGALEIFFFVFHVF